MLLSGAGRPYDPVSGRGVIGRNYADKTFGQVKLFFEDKVFNPFMGGGGIGTTVDDFNGDNFDHAGLEFIGGAHLMVYTPGATPIRNHPVPADTPRWGTRWKQAVAQYYSRNFEITVGGSCQSYRDHYIDLDPTYRDAWGLPLARLTFDWHDCERRMSAYMTGKASELARAIAPAKMTVNTAAGRFNAMTSMSSHNTGGVIMGSDPDTSAVNKYLQCWDVPNLFVVGGSAFPQNPGHHPSGTIGALACWTADAIKDEYLKRPRLLV
jgi:gluconate 2-dehydrogenase alpha chain